MGWDLDEWTVCGFDKLYHWTLSIFHRLYCHLSNYLLVIAR